MITALSEVAQLVAGNWVVKRCVRYSLGVLTSTTCSHDAFLSDLVEEVDRLARVRDYILLSIMHSDDLSVARLDIVDTTVTSGVEVLRILKRLCTLNTATRRWVLKQPRDEAFLAAYVQICLEGG